jgi:hypothetical protein
MGVSMAVVIFTEPTGDKTAINSSAWHTISKADKGRTQIGFSGAQQAIVVRESWEEVVTAIQKAEENTNKA